MVLVYLISGFPNYGFRILCDTCFVLPVLKITVLLDNNYSIYDALKV